MGSDAKLLVLVRHSTRTKNSKEKGAVSTNCERESQVSVLKCRQMHTHSDEGVTLSANDTNTGSVLGAEICSSAVLTELWEFCMSCF